MNNPSLLWNVVKGVFSSASSLFSFGCGDSFWKLTKRCGRWPQPIKTPTMWCRTMTPKHSEFGYLIVGGKPTPETACLISPKGKTSTTSTLVRSFHLLPVNSEQNFYNVKCNVTLIPQWSQPSPSHPSCRAVTLASAPSWRWPRTGWAAKPKRRANAVDTRSCSGTRTSPCESQQMHACLHAVLNVQKFLIQLCTFVGGKGCMGISFRLISSVF